MRLLARSAGLRRCGLLLLAASIVTIVATSQLQAGAAISGSMAGFVPPRSDVHAQDNCPPSGCGSGNLVDHGGPVMTTNKAYSVFWIPTGQTVSAKYVSTINQYF